MFDGLLPEPAALAGVDDAALVGAIAGWARVSVAADARRVAAIAELARRRCDIEEDDPRALWACDPWDAAAGEVSAALNIGHGRAVGELELAVTLRDRLPKLNALFMAGTVTQWAVSTVADRTLLVVDEEVLAQLDTALAEQATSWGPLSKNKLIQSADRLVDEHDPAAVRRTRSAARSRDITIGDPDDAAGTASIWGRLYNTDATLLDRRLTAMAKGVCPDDPRTLPQRRADALGALAAGADHLACICGRPDCPAAADDGRASSVVVHIVADQNALVAQPDPAMNGEGPIPTEPAPAEPKRPAELRRPAVAGTDVAAEPTPAQAEPRRPAAGVMPGGGIVPAPLLAELIRGGAKVRYLGTPTAQAEPGYRSSTALAEFVRTRDLTCRFPGCDRPAEFTDIDHTIAWPNGPTHPSNTKCYCRTHHLTKTFWSGAGGWADRQLPDGTIIITTPAGLAYTTNPASALYFPGWNTTTTPPPTRTAAKPSYPSGLSMPKRKRTRAQDRNYRIQVERALNETRIAENAEPPPF
jgi:Domain of unknown function (DUF222)